MGFRSRYQSAAIGVGPAPGPRHRRQAERAGRTRPVRSRHTLFRIEAGARPVAGVRDAAGQVRRLSRRSHVLFARWLAAGAAERGRGADQGVGRRLRGLYLRSISRATTLAGLTFAPAIQMSLTLPRASR